MEKLPIYKALVKEDDPTGVEFVALVDKPAIEQNWIAFSEDFKPVKQKFKVTSEEKRIISGALMIADMPIYRNDENIGKYYITFGSDVIQSIAQKYFKNKFTSNVNLMHDPSKTVEGVYMFESLIVDSSRGIKAPEGFGLTEGSWFGSFKVDNQDVWDQIKAGDFKGFSVEGLFDMRPAEQKMTSQLTDLEILLSLKF
jgi:hypothetical protein